MIERIILFKLDDEHCNDVGRHKTVTILREGVATLPHLTGYRIGLPSDEPSLKSWDVSIVVEFDTQAHADEAMKSAAWKTLFDDHVGERAIVTKGWSFETQARS